MVLLRGVAALEVANYRICREVTRCDRDGNCVIVREHRFFVEPNFQSTGSDVNQYIGILDLSNGWQPKPNGTFEAVIKVDNDSGQSIEQTFAVKPADSTIANSISNVDKDTTPHSFKFDDSAAVSSFLNNAANTGYSNTPGSISFKFQITQVDCTLATGKYINHLRYKDNSGVTYHNEFVFQYIAPTNSTDCNQGELSVVEN